ncbi:MAG: CPBP family glutamic-type intramembrane protease [Candidatus Eiseniibacteriota bacterium]
MAEDSRTDLKVWGVLAALNLIAALLAVPYTRELLAQSVMPPSDRGLTAHIALALVNAAVIMFPAAALGLRLGRRVGLGAPLLATAFERDASDHARVRSALVRGTWIGLALGALILAGNALFGPELEQELARLGRPVPEHPSTLAGILGSFGAGIGEETLLRLFLLTALYRGFFWLARRAPVEPAHARVAYGIANAVAALVFAALHFGNANVLGLPLGPLTIASVFLFNGAVGIACGELYRSHGIESAMVAHTVTDLVIHGLAPALGWA